MPPQSPTPAILAKLTVDGSTKLTVDGSTKLTVDGSTKLTVDFERRRSVDSPTSLDARKTA
jgi:hypothetical protein